MLLLLLRLCRGLARGSMEWFPVSGTCTGTSICSGSYTEGKREAGAEAGAGAEADPLVGFVLSLVSSYAPAITDPSLRGNCVAVAAAVLVRDVGVDPLFLLHLPQRRRAAYWELYRFVEC